MAAGSCSSGSWWWWWWWNASSDDEEKSYSKNGGSNWEKQARLSGSVGRTDPAGGGCGGILEQVGLGFLSWRLSVPFSVQTGNMARNEKRARNEEKRRGKQ